jgi:multidrug efflux system outer membrane protein
MPKSKPAVVLLGLLSSCSLIPAYHRPTPEISGQWPTTASAANGGAASDIGWQDFFPDPALRGLIGFSLANNQNLRVSVLDVLQAQAQYRVDRASLLPTVDATGQFEAARTPADLGASGQGASGQGASGQGASGSALNFREYSLGVGAVSWEIDLFGKIRSQATAAQETYLSDADTALSSRISLIAEVSSEYYTWLADRESLQISQDTAKAQGNSVRLTQLEAANGIGTALDVAQAETNLYTAQANTALYARQVAQDMDELVLLAGAPLPNALLTQMNTVSNLDATPALPQLPAGLPSDLLERRPDVRAAEHTLRSANANIGAARAAFFPSISLTANGGTASPGLSRLFSGGQGSFLFEPSISIPIFTAGANIANLDIAKVEKNIEIANYEAAIQSAFHDVSDALNARGTYVAQLQAEQNLVDADNRYYTLANMRFRAGVDNYLNVLVAENALLSARLTLVSVKLAARQNNITLYKSLGGGWQNTSGPAPALP